ncbi:hypothetical protein F4V43_00850 [Paenibacillus spiritus]|uniref:Uncharacterized protein n=1 Tax=Paenibacillus spiritus TaxID=2496557 RepID=A0A5J5GLH3_9BACL|nr:MULTISPECIES: hypothetical protein [Paenibacillus]KAA9008463.1 hypothetical protein F4V43_00850 [Paenibacillus spiritus]
MWTALAVIGFVGTVVFLILGLVSVIRKHGTAKRNFIIAAAAFVIMIIGAASTDTKDTEAAGTPSAAPAATAAETAAPSPAVSQPTEDEKAQAELVKKEEADKKAKEIEEARIAAEQQQKEAEEAQATAEKSKFADYMLTIVPSITDDMAELDVQTYQYIFDHSDLFPAVTPEAKQAAQTSADPNVTSKHLQKNITPYLGKMISITGDVISIEETETDIGTVAYVHIVDDNFNSITGIYAGSTGDILEDDLVRLRGVPTASYSFDNVSGGTTNATLLTISTIQKIQ